MDTSVTIIGLVITVLIGIPLYFVFRANAVSKAKTAKILKRYDGYHFYISDAQNKKALHLDATKKGFLFIDFQHDPEMSYFVDLGQMASCRVIPTTKANTDTILKIDFEFQPKTGSKVVTVPFYKIENDQIGQVCLYEDHQLAKKWQLFIQDSIAA